MPRTLQRQPRCEENSDCETHCANDETLKQMPGPHRRRRVRKNVQPGKPLLENNIADPAYYERDPASFQKTIVALDKERATLAALEEEWLELEMLREEMEG